jgi:O-antigen/teichoic acid export membrane protein
MELTKEEKEKIRLEEQERLRVRQEMEKSNKSILVGSLMSLIGGIVAILGLFMPWVSIGALSASGFQKSSDSPFLFIIGIAIILFSLASLLRRENKKAMRLLSISVGVASVIGIILLLLIYPALADQLDDSSAFGLRPQIGIGFWLVGIGYVITLISSTLMTPRKKKAKK